MVGKLLQKLRVSFPRVLLQVLSIWVSFSVSAWGGTYGAHPQVLRLIEEMVVKHQFDRGELKRLFKQAEQKQSILDAISRPAEKTKSWREYQPIFVNVARTSKGVAFWRRHREALRRAEVAYGVPQEIIVAIIGVETRYGKNTGGYRVIDALSTLAFDFPERAEFFRGELKQFLLLTREQQQNPLDLTGSYAGAMGYGQFIPSSYRRYAVDFDGDKFADIWGNPVDAIGSIGNYFQQHGWVRDQAVVVRARVKEGYNREIINLSLQPQHTLAQLRQAGFVPLYDYPTDWEATAMQLEGRDEIEFWLGLKNFYVITRYNHSRLYAMAVFQLSQAIKTEMNKRQKSARLP